MPDYPPRFRYALNYPINTLAEGLLFYHRVPKDDPHGRLVITKQDEQDVKDFLSDGRNFHGIFEKKMMRVHGLRPEVYPGTDFKYLRELKTDNWWEIRMLTNRVNFSPNGDVGKGRSFDPAKFPELTMRFRRYIVADAWSLPAAYYWYVDPAVVILLWQEKFEDKHQIGRKATMSRKNFLACIDHPKLNLSTRI